MTATVETTELDLLLNMKKSLRLAFSVESQTWIMAQIWPHYKSARLELAGIVPCITSSLPASTLHTHKQLLKQLEYELWNRLPQVQIILFPSHSADCLTSLIYISNISFVLFRNQTYPLPVPTSEHANHSYKSSLASFLQQNVCWTGSGVCYGHNWLIFILQSPHVPPSLKQWHYLLACLTEQSGDIQLWCSSALPYSGSELIGIVNTIEYYIYGTLQAYAKKPKQFMASSAYLTIYINAYSSQLVRECVHLQGQNLYFFATKGIAYCKFSHCKMQGLGVFLWVESLRFATLVCLYLLEEF